MSDDDPRHENLIAKKFRLLKFNCWRCEGLVVANVNTTSAPFQSYVATKNSWNCSQIRSTRDRMDTLTTAYYALFIFLVVVWYFWRHDGESKCVHVVVLGDIGRSPRMQYHCLSLAEYGFAVNFIGYAGKFLLWINLTGEWLLMCK